MKVMVKGKIYDAGNDHIAVLLTDKDKENISNMYTDAKVYSMFPEEMDKNVVTELNKKLIKG